MHYGDGNSARLRSCAWDLTPLTPLKIFSTNLDDSEKTTLGASKNTEFRQNTEKSHACNLTIRRESYRKSDVFDLATRSVIVAAALSSRKQAPVSPIVREIPLCNRCEGACHCGSYYPPPCNGWARFLILSAMAIDLRWYYDKGLVPGDAFTM